MTPAVLIFFGNGFEGDGNLLLAFKLLTPSRPTATATALGPWAYGRDFMVSSFDFVHKN